MMEIWHVIKSVYLWDIIIHEEVIYHYDEKLYLWHLNLIKFKFLKQMNANLGDILHHEEIKQLIATLSQTNLHDYLSPTWLKQDQVLQKLNMQLHINALMKND